MPDSPTSEPESDFVCDCKEWMRSACAGEPFYQEWEGKRYCVLHLPGTPKSLDFSKAFKAKLKAKDFNFRGVWFPDELRLDNEEYLDNVDFSDAFFNSRVFFTDARFTMRANFNAATFAMEAYFSRSLFNAKASFYRAKFRGPAYFSAVTFSEVLFSDATFGASLDFSYATCLGTVNFSGITLELWAMFLSATFRERTVFTNANFNLADFRYASFQSSVTFKNARFKNFADFTRSQFMREVDFSGAIFRDDAHFKSVLFGDRVIFAGHEQSPIFMNSSALDLQFARIERPDRVSFHTIALHPHWFINVDPRRFDFINVEWNNAGYAKRELKLLKTRKITSSHRLLAIACRHLAVNAEETHRYEEASKLRFMAMDARRWEQWWGRFAIWRLSWWYRLASGYGERIIKAFVVLLSIWFLAGLIYTRVGFARWEPKLTTEADAVVARRDEVGAPLPFKRALTYSLGVMTLQKPEPRPATTAAQTVVLLETILGPVQAALLALAIRRKFMR